MNGRFFVINPQMHWTVLSTKKERTDPLRSSATFQVEVIKYLTISNSPQKNKISHLSEIFFIIVYYGDRVQIAQ